MKNLSFKSPVPFRLRDHIYTKGTFFLCLGFIISTLLGEGLAILPNFGNFVLGSLACSVFVVTVFNTGRPDSSLFWSLTGGILFVFYMRWLPQLTPSGPDFLKGIEAGILSMFFLYFLFHIASYVFRLYENFFLKKNKHSILIAVFNAVRNFDVSSFRDEAFKKYGYSVHMESFVNMLDKKDRDVLEFIVDTFETGKFPNKEGEKFFHFLRQAVALGFVYNKTIPNEKLAMEFFSKLYLSFSNEYRAPELKISEQPFILRTMAIAYSYNYEIDADGKLELPKDCNTKNPPINLPFFRYMIDEVSKK